MIAEHLLALLVVVPLLAAPVCMLLPNGRAPWVVTTAVSWCALAMSLLLLQQVMEQGVISYHMGGWAPPWGIEYRVDALNAFVAFLIALMGSLILPFALRSVEAEISPEKISGFYTAFLLVFTGLMGMTLTGDVFNVFVFLEISSLATYILISLSDRPRALLAAFQYLVLGTIGATFILIGVGLTYAMTGTLNMADLATRLPELQQSRTIHTGFAFIVIGIAIKLALFPLHVWLPNAYMHAPSVVSAFLAATATKVAFYLLARFVYTIFGASFVFDTTPFGSIGTALALGAILFASYAAIVQSDARRVLAYSSVAQIGYMVLGLCMATSLGVMAGVLHMFNHALMKGALFLSLACVMYQVGSVRIEDLRGVGHRMPWTMSAFVIGGLSLIGVPPTAGFVSKWYLILAALEQGQVLIVLLILVSSLMAVIYVWRIVEAAWMQPAEEGSVTVQEAPLSMLVPTWILVAANIWFGLDTRYSVDLAAAAARSLTGVMP